MEMATPVSSQQFPRKVRWADLTSYPNKENFNSHLQEATNTVISVRGTLTSAK